MMYRNLLELLLGENAENPQQFARHTVHHTQCGPLVSFLTPTLSKGWVDSEDENARNLDWAEACTGVRIGGLAEGSSAEILPIDLIFPFTGDALWNAIAEIDDAASDKWYAEHATDE